MPELEPEPPFDQQCRQRGIKHLDTLRSALTDNKGHNHHKGAEHCPTCKLHNRDENGRHPETCTRCATLTTTLAETSQHLL